MGKKSTRASCTCGKAEREIGGNRPSAEREGKGREGKKNDEFNLSALRRSAAAEGGQIRYARLSWPPHSTATPTAPRRGIISAHARARRAAIAIFSAILPPSFLPARARSLTLCNETIFVRRRRRRHSRRCAMATQMLPGHACTSRGKRRRRRRRRLAPLLVAVGSERTGEHHGISSGVNPCNQQYDPPAMRDILKNARATDGSAADRLVIHENTSRRPIGPNAFEVAFQFNFHSK